MLSDSLQVYPPALERFSFECQKVIGFALSAPHDWLKKFTPLFHPIKVQLKPIVTRLHAFSRALHQLPAITSSFDWFTVLSVSFVIGLSNYFNFGFTILNWKPLTFISNVSFSFNLGKVNWGTGRVWDKEKNPPPTGMKPMISQIPGGRSIHWPNRTNGEQGHLTESFNHLHSLIPTHDDFDSADPSSMQDACPIWTQLNDLNTSLGSTGWFSWNWLFT